MISLHGRAVPGFALGDVIGPPPDPYARLDAMFTLMRGDAASAKTAADYQSVGQWGADTFGPAIDAVGPPEVTQRFTHDAWTINAQLATTTDPVRAKNLLDLMLTDYQKAIAISRIRSKQTMPSGWPVFWVPLGVLVLIAGVWYVVK